MEVCLSKKAFNDFVDMVKIMKCDYFLYDSMQNHILGTDDGFFILKQIELEENIFYYLSDISGDTKDLVRFASFVTDQGVTYNLDGWFYLNDGLPPQSTNTIDLRSLVGGFVTPIVIKFQDIFSRINGIYVHLPRRHLYQNLKSNEKFNELMQLRSDDGVKSFMVGDEFILSIYNNLLPINKPDTVVLEIAEITNGERITSFIAKFMIYKKKKIIVNVFLKYLYLK